VEPINEKEFEFLSGTSSPTGSTEFVVQVDTTPEVDAHAT
jgi:hypothetical protein